MRRRCAPMLLTGLLAAAGLAVAAPAASSGVPQPASVIADACGETSDPALDLQGVAFEYSADSFQVRTTNCASANLNGVWWITVHLTSFTPEIRITGAMDDLGKYSSWSRFYLCATGSCPVHYGPNGVVEPAGRRLPGFDYWRNLNLPTLSGRSAFGYGAWRDNLPAGTAVPASIHWWAELRGGPLPTGNRLDRAPETGSVVSVRIASPGATAVTVRPGVPQEWRPLAPFRTDSGSLLEDSPGGPPLPNRYVSIALGPGPGPPPHSVLGSDVGTAVETLSCANCNLWATSYPLSRNSTVRAYFQGDGYHSPSWTAPYAALVRAWVTLDLPTYLTVRRGSPVVFHGVVRPRALGTPITVQIRYGGPGAPWTPWRRYLLSATSVDTYYSFTWHPTVAGTFAFRTVWSSGTTADGGVTDGTSAEAAVTVT